MKKFWETTPVIRAIYWHAMGRWLSAREQKRWSGQPVQDVFSEIYQTNRWQDADSRSGTGSNLDQTAAVRAALPGIFERYGIKSFLDIPCGDFYWMSKVDLSGIFYTGGDIVPALIEQNLKQHKSASISFRVINLIEDELPTADLLMVRDCLVHLSFADALRAVANIARSPVRYLLATTFIDITRNDDIVTGQWRMLNLSLPPFSFPAPVELIDEKCTESREAKGKRLGLWDVSGLRVALAGP